MSFAGRSTRFTDVPTTLQSVLFGVIAGADLQAALLTGDGDHDVERASADERCVGHALRRVAGVALITPSISTEPIDRNIEAR